MKKIQQHIKELYYQKDKKRPIEKNILKFIEEIGELSEAIIKQEKKQMEEEFADVLAWLVSLANIYDIDLETAFYKKYPPGPCPKCHQKPCICPDF